MALSPTSSRSSSGGGLSLIGSVTVSATPLTIDFASIPQTYTHLMLFTHLRQSNAATIQSCSVRFNGDATANAYIWESTQSQNLTLTGVDNIGTTSDIGGSLGNSGSGAFYGGTYVVIPFYTTNHAKTWHYMTGVIPTAATKTGAWYRGAGGLWANTAAITSISLSPDAFAGVVTWIASSTATLYGI